MLKEFNSGDVAAGVLILITLAWGRSAACDSEVIPSMIKAPLLCSQNSTASVSSQLTPLAP